MTLAEVHDADMAVILSDAGNTFSFDGVSYPCILADLVKRKDLAEGGFLPDYDFSISTRLSIMPATPPAAGDTVTVDSVDYRVMRVRSNFTGKILVLDLMTIHK